MQVLSFLHVKTQTNSVISLQFLLFGFSLGIGNLFAEHKLTWLSEVGRGQVIATLDAGICPSCCCRLPCPREHHLWSACSQWESDWTEDLRWCAPTCTYALWMFVCFVFFWGFSFLIVGPCQSSIDLSGSGHIYRLPWLAFRPHMSPVKCDLDILG